MLHRLYNSQHNTNNYAYVQAYLMYLRLPAVNTLLDGPKAYLSVSLA
jgi:hypothetical protein